jgi:hypothetical protein
MSLYQSIRELRQGNRRRHPSPTKRGRRLVVEALEGRALMAGTTQTGNDHRVMASTTQTGNGIIAIERGGATADGQSTSSVAGKSGISAGKFRAVVGIMSPPKPAIYTHFVNVEFPGLDGGSKDV